MSYADRIRQAKSQPEAMLVIAEGLDELLSRVEAAGPPIPSSEWETWGTSENTGADAAGGQAVNDGRVSPAVGSSSPVADAHPFDVIKIVVDPAELAAARDNAHQAEINFEALRSRGPQAGQGAQMWEQELNDTVMAMKRAQARVRQLEDPGGILNHAGEIPGQRDNTVTVSEGDGLIVEMAAVDERRKTARQKLARAINLPSYFPTIWRTGQAAEDLIHAFELGGPIWLNANGRFDGQPPVIMQMPEAVKRAFVEDVRQDSERIAYDLARELFKGVDEGHLDISGQAVDGMLSFGGTPYSGKGDA